VVVGVDPSLPPTLLAQVLHKAGPRAIVLAQAGQVSRIPTQFLNEETPIFLLEGDAAASPHTSARLVAIAEAAHDGQRGEARALVGKTIEELGSSDPATLIFTSGTTGEPKGILITHGQLLLAAGRITERLAITEKDTTICWLPLSHL